MKKSIYLIFTSLLSFSVQAHDYLDMSLEQLMNIKVTGSTRTNESMKSVPAAVSVFTHEQLEQMGIDYVYELLGLVPGYQFNRNGDSPTGYTFSARGRRNSAEAREVLLLVDGRVFVDPRTGGADGSLPLFPLAQIERIEVIRGPSSAIYGSSAFNGVINIISRTKVNSVKASIGSQRQASAQILLSSSNEEWQSNMFAKILEDKGESYLFENIHTNDPRKAIDVDVNLAHGNTVLRAAYHQVIAENFYIGETLRNDFNESSLLLQHISIEQKLTLKEKLQTQLEISYVNIDQVFQFMAAPETSLKNISQPASDDALFIKGNLAGETYRFTLHNNWEVNKNSSVQFGLDLHTNHETKAQAYNNFDLGQLAQGDFPISYYGDFSQSTPAGNNATQRTVGFYSQYMHAFSDSTQLTLGVRHDRYSEIGGYTSPRLGLVQQLNSHQSLKLLYGEAYRAPSLSELGLKNNPIIVGNKNLDYETVKTWDLIWLGSWQKTNLSVNGFVNNYQQPIATGILGTTRTYVNGDDEYSDGLEFELNQQLSEQWLMRATYTNFLHLPDTAFREAKQLASFLLNYEVSKWVWSVSAIHQGNRNFLISSDEQKTLDDFWNVNSKIIYHLNKQYDIHAQIKNIANEQFATPAQGVGFKNGVLNRGREWSVGVTVNF